MLKLLDRAERRDLRAGEDLCQVLYFSGGHAGFRQAGKPVGGRLDGEDCFDLPGKGIPVGHPAGVVGEPRVVRDLGLMQSFTLLENARLIGYELAIKRLIEAKPTVVAEPSRSAPAAAPTVRAGTA